MSLVPGTRLGPYEITGVLGAGGMGQVCRARDTRLDRIVAIKLLSPQLVSGPELRLRLQREAQAVSSLNHPHICTLYDIGHQDGTDYLVMEYIEGQTLAQRLEKRPLGIEEALRYAVEIADALQCAHAAGILHRDVKPANIMLTKNGTKLLDFGLAKRRVLHTAETGHTVTDELTTGGALVGTVPYMAPEVVEGHEADARADIFGLGAVLYEMLAGRKAFEGETPASVIAAILDRDPPPIAGLEGLHGAALQRTIGKALAKKAEDRWQTARDLRDELEWIAGLKPPAADSVPMKPGRARMIAVALLVSISCLALLWVLRDLRRDRPAEPVVRFALSLPDNTVFTSLDTTGATPQIALSPDGRTVAFCASQAAGPSMLWVRALDSFTAQMLPGTEGASFPFWSPDNRTVGFFADAKLKTIDIERRVPQAIADAPAGRGGTWNREGTIVFADNISSPLKQVPADGGVPRAITALDRSQVETSHRFPQFLPDGRHFTYLSLAGANHVGLYLGSLDSRSTSRLLPGKWASPFAVGGYLLCVREGTLAAHEFDLTRLMPTGAHFQVADPVASGSPSGFAAFSASATGSLIYSSGSSPNRELAWFSRNGRRLGAVGSGEYASPALARNGKRIAVAQVDPHTRTPDIWVFDLSRGTETRVTFDPAADRAPLWSPDGGSLAFASDRTGQWELYIKAVDSAKAEELIATSPNGTFPSDWSADGRYILYHSPSPQTNWDIWAVDLTGQTKPKPVVQTPFNEVEGVLSPDDRWLAYTSDESGTPEVYVQSFPIPGNKSQVSVHGGYEPKWSANGTELFYISAAHKLVAVKVRLHPVFEAGVLSELFALPVPDFKASFPVSYAVVAGNQQFLVNTVVPNKSPPAISVVLNWTAALKPSR